MGCSQGFPRAPSCLNSRLLGYVTIGYIDLGSHYLGNWSPRVYLGMTWGWGVVRLGVVWDPKSKHVS